MEGDILRILVHCASNVINYKTKSMVKCVDRISEDMCMLPLFLRGHSKSCFLLLLLLLLLFLLNE
jgi:hypothetical protein